MTVILPTVPLSRPIPEPYARVEPVDVLLLPPVLLETLEIMSL